MDKLDHYRKIIEEELNYYATIPYSNIPELDRVVIIDREKDHFLLMDLGWVGKKQYHDCMLQLEIKNDKIWIHQDWTDIDMVELLMRHNIPRSEIVLGFISPFERQFSEFAVE